jgi:hypothetical protein
VQAANDLFQAQRGGVAKPRIKSLPVSVPDMKGRRSEESKQRRVSRAQDHRISQAMARIDRFETDFEFSALERVPKGPSSAAYFSAISAHLSERTSVQGKAGIWYSRDGRFLAAYFGKFLPSDPIVSVRLVTWASLLQHTSSFRLVSDSTGRNSIGQTEGVNNCRPNPKGR